MRGLGRREVWSRTLVEADSAPRVWWHDKEWRLRFVVAPTEQLRINFEVAPNQTRRGTVAATALARYEC
jgi:hypothetical protein